MKSKKKDKFAISRNLNLHFTHLPAYARWIKDNQLEEFSRLMIEFSKAEDIPILRFFKEYTDQQLIEIGKVSGSELLDRLANNKAAEHISITVEEWRANQLEQVDRDAIMAEDISLISLVRRKVFRLLLQQYATDTKDFGLIMEEVDRFTAESDIAAFNAYIAIHQEKIEQMNRQLEDQREELLEAQQLTKTGSFFWDLEGRGRSVFTPMVMKIFEMEQTSNLDSFIKDVHPEDRDMLQNAIERALKKDGIYECEYRYQRNNKKKRIWSRGIVEFNEGKPVGMKGIVMDTTVKSELVEKLLESEKLHKQAQALTHIGNWSWDIASGEITWSDEMYRIYGLEPQSEVISFERFMSLVHPDNRASRMEEIERSLKTGIAEDYILKIITPAGEEKILKGKGEMEKDREGKPVRLNGTCQDITVEHKLTEALKEQEQYMGLLINNAPDAIIVIDENSIIRLWNPKTELVFGWKAEEVVGRHLADTIIPPRYREAHTRGLRRYLATGEGTVINQTTELIGLNKANEELFVSLTISQTIQQGRRSFIAFLRDVTKEKQIEIELRNKSLLLEQRNRQLEYSNKELESFNYAASHDLQEPLRKIQVFASRITEAEPEIPSHLRLYLDKINASAAHMQRLVDDLLRFSQITAPNEAESTVDLSEVLIEAKNILAHQIEESGARILNSPLPVIKAIPFQIQQLLINLLSNAIKYRKPGITPEIWIGAVSAPVAETERFYSLGNTNHLKLSVADNGIGFEPRYADRLFELFTRLHNKQQYTGTGIGLAICKKIVQNHQGLIIAESDGTSGATFHIYLPEDRLITNL